MRSRPCLSFLILTTLLAAACTGPEELELASVEQELSCPTNKMSRSRGARYTHNNRQWELELSNVPGRVRYVNRALDGSWTDRGYFDRWKVCPLTGSSAEAIRATPDAAAVWNGHHVCLGGSREELHRPGLQVALTRLTYVEECVSWPHFRNATPPPALLGVRDCAADPNLVAGACIAAYEGQWCSEWWVI